jgi:hypothetical protein
MGADLAKVGGGHSSLLYYSVTTGTHPELFTGGGGTLYIYIYILVLKIMLQKSCPKYN